ncbi:MAG: secretion protein HlyD [Pelagibacterales bacterium]|nr:secretion protein HlyD [Pelagibacterales bacterium]
MVQHNQAEPLALASNYEPPFSSHRPSSSSKSIVIIGIIIVVSIFLGLGVWAATAPLAKAVAAAAQLSVRGDKKRVQHYEGGIVAAIDVSEGEKVSQGQLLVSMDPLQANATLTRVRDQLSQGLALQDRLESELKEENTITFSSDILDRVTEDEGVIEIIEAEQKHFFARRETLNGHLQILRQRQDQLVNEIKGLEIQKASRIKQRAIFRDELKGLRQLYEKGYYPKTKILAMERAIVQLEGAIGNDSALIARAISAQGEAKNQIVSLRQRFREDVVALLQDTKAKISDLHERLLVAKDVLQRIEIRAPRSGIVQAVQVHTIGGVVAAGQVLMEIAPVDDDLVVKATISPMDVDNLAVGQEAEVRLTGLNLRSTPAIYGSVASISGDALTDSNTGAPFFLARIEIRESERKKLGDTKLSAGMPAEVLINTGERTVLDYILKPLKDAIARGLNEE